MPLDSYIRGLLLQKNKPPPLFKHVVAGMVELATRWVRKLLWSTERSRLEKCTQRCTVCHKEAGKRLFVCPSFWKKTLVGLYYTALAYAVLGKKSQVTKMYSEVYRKAMTSSFHRGKLELSITYTDDKRADRSGVGDCGSILCDTID